MQRTLGQKRKFYKKKYPQAKYPRVSQMGTLSSTRGFRDHYGFNKRSITKEKKFFDTVVAGQTISSAAGNFNPFFLPALGTEYNQRIGRKCVAKSMYIRGRIQIATTAPIITAAVGTQQNRFIVFMDMQPNGVVPALTDLLTTADPSSQLNPNNRDRFRVIKDKYYSFDPFVYNSATGTGALNRTIYDMKIYKKLNCEVIFNQNTTSTINAIATCAIYYFFLGSINNASEFTINTRVRYDDS